MQTQADEPHEKHYGEDIPPVDDLQVCQNCGWRGHNSEFHILGIDADIVDEFVAGECTMECPECRTDPGWQGPSEVFYCFEDFEITGQPPSIQASTMADTYQIGAYIEANPEVTAIINLGKPEKNYDSETFLHQLEAARISKSLWRRPFAVGVRYPGNLC